MNESRINIEPQERDQRNVKFKSSNIKDEFQIILYKPQTSREFLIFIFIHRLLLWLYTQFHKAYGPRTYIFQGD